MKELNKYRSLSAIVLWRERTGHLFKPLEYLQKIIVLGYTALKTHTS